MVRPFFVRARGSLTAAVILRAARPLFYGDAFHDGAAACADGEWNFGLGYGGVDERGDFGVGECLRSGQANETVLRAAAEQDFVRVGERRAPIEREADAFGIGGEGDDAVRGAHRAAVTNDEEIVIVVDDLVRGREALAQYGAARPDLFGDRGIEFGDEAVNLFGGRYGGRRGFRCGRRLAGRSFFCVAHVRPMSLLRMGSA